MYEVDFDQEYMVVSPFRQPNREDKRDQEENCTKTDDMLEEE